MRRCRFNIMVVPESSFGLNRLIQLRQNGKIQRFNLLLQVRRDALRTSYEYFTFLIPNGHGNILTRYYAFDKHEIQSMLYDRILISPKIDIENDNTLKGTEWVMLNYFSPSPHLFPVTDCVAIAKNVIPNVCEES